MTPSSDATAGTRENLPSDRARGQLLNPRDLATVFSATSLSATEDSNDSQRVLAAAVTILEQGEVLLGALPTADYTQKVPVVFNASIGGHYRHCLDHFTSLLRGWNAAAVDYDHRERDLRIESEPAFALAVTRDLREQLQGLRSAALACPALARCEVSYAHGDSPAMKTSLGRELVYCIAHAIHHYALIAVMARLMNTTLPPQFGVAPTTVAHLARQPAEAN